MRTPSPHGFPAGPVRGASRLAMLLLFCTATGCFVKTYEERLNTTVRLYQHFDELNRNLRREWSGPGLRLRAPMQFDLLPPPPPPEEPPPSKDGKPVKRPPPPKDDRQPSYLNLELPGLMGAWKANLHVNVDGKAADHPGYLYLLSNYYLWAVPPQQKDRIDPLKLDDQVKRLIQAKLKVRMEDKDFVNSKFPAGFDLVPKVIYDSITVQPSMPIDGVKYKVPIYFYNKGDTRVIVMFVIPEGVENDEKLPERIALSLETLKASGEKPTGVGAVAPGAPPPAKGL